MFLTINDFCRLYQGVRSQSWCYRAYRTIKDAYGLDKPYQVLLVSQYCEYMQVPEAVVHQGLGWTVSTTTGSKKAAAV